MAHKITTSQPKRNRQNERFSVAVKHRLTKKWMPVAGTFETYTRARKHKIRLTRENPGTVYKVYRLTNVLRNEFDRTRFKFDGQTKPNHKGPT